MLTVVWIEVYVTNLNFVGSYLYQNLVFFLQDFCNLYDDLNLEKHLLIVCQKYFLYEYSDFYLIFLNLVHNHEKF